MRCSVGPWSGGPFRRYRPRSSPGICGVTSTATRRSYCLSEMDLVITYDIADTDGAGSRRLRRVHEVCSAYGEWVQFSVFEFRLSADRVQRLINELSEEIDPSVDSVRIYRFDGNVAEGRTCLGRPSRHQLGEPWIV